MNEPYLGTPVPVRGTACGLAPPSSTIFRDACRLPLAPGVKVTSIVQLRPAASLDPHVVVSAKSPLMRLTNVVIDQAGNIWALNNWKPDFDIDVCCNPGGDGAVIFVGLAPPPASQK